MITTFDRARFYSDAFPKFPPLQASDKRVWGYWELGQDYHGNGYYGGYPGNSLKRIMSLFPEVHESEILHVCSGGLPEGPYRRFELNPTVEAEFHGNAEVLSSIVGIARWRLIIIDPPYTGEDAEHYGYPLLSRVKVLEECRLALLPEVGNVVWMDQFQPQWSKQKLDRWLTIGLGISSNRRFRCVIGYRRVS